VPLGGYAGWACQYAAETDQEAEGCPNFFYYVQANARGGSEDSATIASSLMGIVTGILKDGEKGGKIALGALEEGGRFVSRNAGKFVSMLGDFGTFAEATLALQVGGAACVAGAVGAGVVAPFTAPFAWFGCATFIFGNAAMMGWSAYDLWTTAKHIH
jgi:hypothetical protein